MILINDYNLHGHFCKRAFNPLTSFHDLHFAKTCRSCRLIISELWFVFFHVKLTLSELYFAAAGSSVSYLTPVSHAEQTDWQKSKVCFLMPRQNIAPGKVTFENGFSCRDRIQAALLLPGSSDEWGVGRRSVLFHGSRHVRVAFLLRKGTPAFQTEARSLTFQEEGQF